MEFGIYTFGDNTPDQATGETISAYERLQHILEEAELAEQLGLQVYAVGEHHRHEFVISSPATVLAAIAARTKKIKLSSAVTVLSSDDPVRVFQEFATVDLISKGRAEIMAGRGSFIESFPLFGYDLQDYDSLFEEKLDLLMQINEQEFITWKGEHRSAIKNLGIYPRPYQSHIPIWIAVGGTPASVIRAAKLGLPLALAIIGGYPEQFVPIIRLYKDTYKKAAHLAPMQLSINTHVFVAETSQAAADIFYPSYAHLMSTIGKERGWSGMTRSNFDAMRSPAGSLMVGSPNEVAEKMIREYELFGYTRFLAQMAVGSIPHKDMLRSIELYATKVLDQVKRHIAEIPVAD